MSNSNCAENFFLHEYLPFRVALGWQSFLCVGTVVTITVYLIKYSSSAVYHPNLRMLLQVYLNSFLVRAVTGSIVWIRTLILYTYYSPCDYQISVVECFIFRHLGATVIVFLSFLQLFIAIERCCAHLTAKTYETRSYWFGLLMVVISVFMAEAIVLSLMWVFPLGGFVSHCQRSRFFVHIGFIDGADVIYSLPAVLDIISVIVLIVLQIESNKKKEDFADMHRYQYYLSEKFENKRNRAVLRALFPLFAAHTFASVFFTIAQYSIRHMDLTEIQMTTYTYFAYISPLYCFVSPILLWWRLHRKSIDPKIGFTKNIGDQYFDALSKAWN